MLLKQDTTRSRLVDKNEIELNAGNNKSGEYKLKVIQDSAVYARELETGHLINLYYVISWKSYLEEENTWKLYSVVQYLKKLISSFYKDYFDKPTATSEVINTSPPMAK